MVVKQWSTLQSRLYLDHILSILDPGKLSPFDSAYYSVIHFKQKPCIMLGLKNLLWTWLPGYQDTFMFFLIDLVIKYIMITLKCNEYIYVIIRLSASETVGLDSFVCFFVSST